MGRRAGGGYSGGGGGGGSSWSSSRATTVYTDGACSRNGNSGARAGYGAYYGDGRSFSGSVSGAQTSNRAELTAVQRVVERERGSAAPLVVKTDSRYVADGVNSWSRNWESNGYRTADGGAVKNQDLWRSTTAAIADRRASFQAAGKDPATAVRVEYVPREHNAAADALARQAARK